MKKSYTYIYIYTCPYIIIIIIITIIIIVIIIIIIIIIYMIYIYIYTHFLDWSYPSAIQFRLFSQYDWHRLSLNGDFSPNSHEFLSLWSPMKSPFLHGGAPGRARVQLVYN